MLCHQSPLSKNTAGSTFTTQFHIGFVRSLANPLIGSSRQVFGSNLLFYNLNNAIYFYLCFLDLTLMNESTFF
jgi:hypothetical protein